MYNVDEIYSMEEMVVVDDAVAVKQTIRMLIGCWIFDENHDREVCSGRRITIGQDVYE